MELEDITVFLKTGVAPEGMKALERKHLTILVTPYMLISGDMFKLGCDEVLCQCVLEHERVEIMDEVHGGIAGGHYVGNTTTWKILMEGIWWETIYQDCIEFFKAYDPC